MPKDLIANTFEIVEFIIINADKDCPVVGKQPLQQLEPGVHHAQPLVVAGEVFALLADHVAQPLFNARVADIVVIHPALVARVIGGIDIDALDAALVLGQQGFERLQIVAPDDLVPVRVFRAGLAAAKVGVLMLQHPVGHLQMVIDHLIFSDPFKRRHGSRPPFR